MTTVRVHDLAFPHNWEAQMLTAPPLIAPARQFVYPQQVPGEEDTLARGAFQLLVKPVRGGDFLATCALGFNDPSMPTGLLSCPNPDELCALAGGYAYIIDTAKPPLATHIPLRPVVEARALPEHNLLIFTGFHTLLAWGTEGLAWQTARLTWEGLRITSVEGGIIRGLGWHLPTDKEVPFAVDPKTGQHTGGAY